MESTVKGAILSDLNGISMCSLEFTEQKLDRLLKSKTTMWDDSLRIFFPNIGGSFFFLIA